MNPELLRALLVVYGPTLVAMLEREKTRIESDDEQMKTIRCLEASRALFAVGGAIIDRYGTLKQRRGLSDFSDLIRATSHLLLRSEIRGWVQYKLDRGIQHILVDEAQDTSPAHDKQANSGAPETAASPVFRE